MRATSFGLFTVRLFTLLLICAGACTSSAWAGEKPAASPAKADAKAGAPLVLAPVDLSKGKHLFTVAQVHLDTNFNWTFQETIRLSLPDTLHRNFELIEKYPHYIFNFEGAFRYGLIKEYYPQDYAKLKKYVAQGRWAPCGAHVDAMDVNIPAPESLIRQFLYGNHFYRREFGKSCNEVLLPDCFGFPYSLPTIEAHCGLKGFSTQKLGWTGFCPFEFGRWQGVDGSEIAGALNAGSYGHYYEKDPSADRDMIAIADSLGAPSGVYLAYHYYGAGDFGGTPTDKSVEVIEKATLHPSGPLTVHSATADQAFLSLTPAQFAKLPKYTGELLLAIHSTGGYTILSQFKRWNRRNEQLADAAERASVAADWLGGALYPKEQINEAWWRLLQNQDHNTMSGGSVPEVFPFVWNDQAVVMNQFADTLGTGVGAVARALDTRAEGTAVVVYNPLACARRDVVDAVVRFPGAAPKAVRVLGPDGKPVPAQLGPATAEGQHVLFAAELPSVGYAVYDVQPAAAPMEAGELKVSPTLLENARYRVRIDAKGDITGITDKLAGRELLSAPIRLQMLDDNAMPQFRPWRIMIEDIGKPPRAALGDDPGVQVRVAEQGPARVAVEIVRTTGHKSTAIQTVRLASGGQTVEAETRLAWNDRNTLLKAAFPLAVANPEATYDLGIGTIRRGNNNPDKYEVPAQQWADITAPDGRYGVSILSDSRLGWDKPADGQLRLTLLHAPPAGYFPHQSTLDFGMHRLAYAIAGHAGDWQKGGSPWLAARLNQPLRAFQAPSHPGKLGRSWSLLSVDSPQVMVKAVKQAEDNNKEVIVRVQELAGRPASGVKLAWATPIASAREVNGQEEPLGPATLKDGALVFDLKPYQPRAFALKLGTPPKRLKAASGRPVPLPFDADIFSRDGEKGGGDLDGQGTTLSGNQLPARLVSGGIPFALGGTDPGRKNALVCRGQRIELPQHIKLPWERPSRAYVLACAVGGDRAATFQVDGKPVTVTVCDAFENLGAWEIRDGRSYLKETPLAWIGTHRNLRDGTADPYRFGYLHRCAVALPKGAKVLTLPGDEHLRLAALTVADDPEHDTIPAGTLMDPPLSPEEFARPGLTYALRAPENPAGAIPGLTMDGYTFEQEFKLWWMWGAFADGSAAAKAKGTMYWALQILDAAKKDLEKNGAKAIPAREVASPGAAQAPRPEKYALRLTGYLTLPKDGIYRFALRGGDSSQLFIGDYMVVDNDMLVDNEGWPRRMKEQGRDEIPLKAGTHAVTLFCAQPKGEPGLEVLWQLPGADGSFEPIPAAAWTHLKR